MSKVRQDPVLLSPLILTAFIAVLEGLTPPEMPIARLLPAVPALATALWPVVPTLVLGLVCLSGSQPTLSCPRTIPLCSPQGLSVR